MSRIGRMPITVPAGVTVEIKEGNVVTVKGANGTLTEQFSTDMNIALDAGVITVTRPSDVKEHRALHGLTRTLISNMIIGVSQGFKKDLEIEGVGYKAAKEGKNLVLNLGYSHPIVMPEPEGITITVTSPVKLTVFGADKQLVGAIAADIRGKRPPEPYHGKGVRYAGEVIRRKAGKSGKK